MKRALFILFLTLSSLRALSTEMVLSLNGFYLGQYREVAKNELGLPYQKDKFDDGFEYEAFLIKPDSSVYMIFEYSNINLQVFWSVQLTGSNYKTDFKGLNLGDNSSEVLRILGNPSAKIDAGEYGERWEYEGTNYSIEINKKGKLSSIKISDESLKLFPRVAVEKIPKFESIKSILQSGDKSVVQSLLCPDVEIYYNNSTVFFKKSIQSEIATDESGIFKLIRTLSVDLDKVNIIDQSEYEENIRVVEHKDPMHVIKIKKGNSIKEIVFKYVFGKYLIWEIKSQLPNRQASKP